jgi:electron transport complex protein RnfD
MARKTPSVEIRTSPYIRNAPSVAQIMRNVVYALLPICAYAVYQFGISALALIMATTLACLLTEQFFCRLSAKTSTLGDYSAAITGILLALTLPPGFPLWMASVAGFMAIALGKLLFGGLGYNPFNPALVGRAFVQAAFPVAITTWSPAFASNRFAEFVPSTLAAPLMTPEPVAEWAKTVAVDGFSGATPLALMKFERIMTPSADLFLGTTAGSAGETSALLILLCGLYLAARNMLDWRIPAAVLFGAAVSAEFFHWLDAARYPGAAFMLCSGGLMLGAVFMATDMVSSPVTPLGICIYGVLIGLLTVVIRLFGGLSEGVMYAILLANAASPIIESFTQPRVYGAGKK